MLGFLPAFGSLLGSAYAHTGRLAEGLGLLEEAVDQGEIRIRHGRPRWLSLQSEALLLASQAGDAKSRARRGLEGARARGERGEEAVCLRALGEAEASGSPLTPKQRSASSGGDCARHRVGDAPLVAHCHPRPRQALRAHGPARAGAGAPHRKRATMYREMDMRFWLEQAEAESMEPGA
jgi:hypothetical protein